MELCSVERILYEGLVLSCRGPIKNDGSTRDSGLTLKFKTVNSGRRGLTGSSQDGRGDKIGRMPASREGRHYAYRVKHNGAKDVKILGVRMRVENSKRRRVFRCATAAWL